MSDQATALANSEQSADNAKTILGFWTYLMTDCVLFASLFAVYAVLHNNTFGGESARTLFSLPYALAETFILLTSSFACGLAILTARQRRQTLALTLFGMTFVLGLAFLAMELTEFHHLAVEGNSWRRSGFLSAYFTLVGAHGLHIVTGLLWMLVLMFKVIRGGLTSITLRRLTLLSMFWHFLDVIWIFIFTIVYLLGAIS